MHNPAPEKQKTFVLVRQDLPLPQQMVQACHAAMGAGFDFKADIHPHMVLLGVPDSEALEHWGAELARLGVPAHMFFEPDDSIGNSALATAPLPKAMWRHFRKLRLWGDA